MLPTTGAQLGMSTRRVTSDSELMPRVRPKRAIPMGSPIAMTDPNARSRMTTAATSPISSPMPVSASSNAVNRSPPSSTRRGESWPASTPTFLRFSRSTVSSFSSTGYWTRMSATRPSEEMVPLPTAASCPAWSAPAGSLVESTRGKAATSSCTSVSASRARAESKNVVASSRGVRTSWAVSPARSDPAEDSRSVARCESSPGAPKDSSSFSPNAVDAPMTSSDMTSQDPMTTHGRRAAPRPNRYKLCVITVFSLWPCSGGLGRYDDRRTHRFEARGCARQALGWSCPGPSAEPRVVLWADP